MVKLAQLCGYTVITDAYTCREGEQAREIVQPQRVLAALAENPLPVRSTQTVAYSHLRFQLQDTHCPFLASIGTCTHVYTIHTDTYASMQ